MTDQQPDPFDVLAHLAARQAIGTALDGDAERLVATLGTLTAVQLADVFAAASAVGIAAGRARKQALGEDDQADEEASSTRHLTPGQALTPQRLRDGYAPADEPDNLPDALRAIRNLRANLTQTLRATDRAEAALQRVRVQIERYKREERAAMKNPRVTVDDADHLAADIYSVVVRVFTRAVNGTEATT